jgi:predicted metal-dependent HD superfamily phosphohydrolase
MSSNNNNSSEGKPKKDHNKKFFEDHPELTKDLTCPECGLTYKYSHKSRHYKSQKHIHIITVIALDRLKNQIKNTQSC